jgi:uncharacterized membrane protein
VSTIGQALKKLGRDISVKNEKTAYIIAVALALIIASSLFVVYICVLQPYSSKYTNISVLNSNRQAGDLPEKLVVGVNNTFSLYVNVENHMQQTLENATVFVKVAPDNNITLPLTVEPIQTLSSLLKDGQSWESETTVTLDDPGNYLVVFELWMPYDGVLTFSEEAVALSIQVTAQ